MKLALFLTSGTSLKLWHDRGWLDGGTAIKAYNAWGKHFEKIYLISYGNNEEVKYLKYFNPNFRVLPKTIPLPSFVYSFVIPFVYRKELKNCEILITTQMEGSWSAAITKFFFHNKFILRCGYLWSLSLFNNNLKCFTWKIMAPFLEHIVYRVSDQIIVTSGFAKHYVTKKYGIPTEKIAVIKNPVDTSLFKPRNSSCRPDTLVYVGRLEKEKNPRLLLEAIVRLNVKLTIFGTGSLKPELESFAAKNNLQVDFKGNVTTDILAKELSNNEIFIAPSLFENSPKALLEAMSCGLAVVGTNVRGINEVIHDGENGILCDSNPQSLRQALIKLLENTPLRKKLGDNARAYVCANFNLENKIAADLEVFDKFLS